MDISVSKLMELFLETLDKCGLYLLDMDDKYIEYNIFEVFDIGAVSFLHERTLLRLRNANLIDEKILAKCIELRSRYMEIQHTNLWSVCFVKNNIKWKKILELSDEIKSMLGKQ